MKVNGEKIKLMDKESTCTMTELCIKAVGKMINNMVMELRPGPMKQDMKEHM